MKRLVPLLLLPLLLSAVASSQELEPRAYAITPVNANAVNITYVHGRGEAAFDPTLPLDDVQATTHTLAAAYYRSFDFFGRSANFLVAQPYTIADLTGFVEGEYAEGRWSGLKDVQFRFAVNLYGAPAMDLKEFSEYKYDRNLGFSIKFVPPTGQYDPNRLINLSSNRWSFKPELAYTRGFGEKKRWIAEVYGGVWLFTDNKDFAGGSTRSQNPIGSFQFHLVRNFARRAWASLDVNYFTGGRSSLNNEARLDLQKNSRVGGTFGLPVHKGHGLKFSVSTGAYTTIGADFTVVSVGYQYTWLDK